MRSEVEFAGLGENRFEAAAISIELRIPFGATGRAGGGRQSATFTSGADANCEVPAGSGFANAARRTQACDSWGSARTEY